MERQNGTERGGTADWSEPNLGLSATTRTVRTTTTPTFPTSSMVRFADLQSANYPSTTSGGSYQQPSEPNYGRHVRRLSLTRPCVGKSRRPAPGGCSVTL